MHGERVDDRAQPKDEEYVKKMSREDLENMYILANDFICIKGLYVEFLLSLGDKKNG